MKARRAASVVLAAALLIGTAGCTLFAPQGTLKHYEPSDGIGATVGDLQIRNLLGVTEDGRDVALVLTIVNNSDTDQTVDFQYESGNGKKRTESVDVDAHSAVSIGGEDQDSLVLRNADAEVGGLLPVYVQYGDEPGKQLQVPVLTPEMQQYNDLAPRPLPTLRPTESATPEPTETPAP